MQENNSLYNRLKYIHRQDETSMNKLLVCDDGQRLDDIIYVFYTKQMIRKRIEKKVWHPYFRRIATNAIVFYQNSSSIFYNDIQYDNEQFQINGVTFIHGNLHIGQFLYRLNDINYEWILKIKKHTMKKGPITWDLKRLSANISLIAYYQGFSDIEMIEILEIFINEYIKSVLSFNKNNLKKQNSIENYKINEGKPLRLQKQHSCLASFEVPHESHNIKWESIDTVKQLIILVKQLAIATANLHCESPKTNLNNSTKENNINDCAEILQTALSSITKQQELINEICSFAMIYAQIAERNHRLFFKNYRNEQIFALINNLTNHRIERPLKNTRRENILIIGGGIGGMATALSFAQAGIKVKLIEKNLQFTEFGAGMQLAPNCSRLLDRLGILKQVQINAVFPKEIVWMDVINGQRIASIDLGDQFIETFGYPYIVVHRADLLNALYQACITSSMVTMETNRMVINVDERPQSIMVQCADGMRYDCDMVIAADGLWSLSRKFVCDDGQPISVGYVTYRGTVEIDQVSKEAGLENVQFWIGPDMHLVQYPIRRGELFNQAAVFKSYKVPDETDQWGTKEELNERFSIGCQHVQNALNLLQTNIRWPIYDRNPLSKWSRGRLVLLGYAAHPMLQYAGQGAAQALEDAYALVTAYKKHGPSKIHTIFHEYEQERIPRSSKVVHFAREIGIFAHHNGIAKLVRDAILRTHDSKNFEFIKWLYAEKQSANE